MNDDMIKWAVGIALGVAGFLLGGGWPWKAYRRMGDLDLSERMKPTYWTRTEQAAFERENDMRHQRQDEVMGMLRDTQRAILALTGAVERNAEGLKYLAGEIEEVKGDIENLRKSLASP